MNQPADDDEPTSPSADSDKMIGRVVAGNFRIEALLGAGAMGNVYQAEQLSLGKAVAIKILHPHLQTEEKLTIRFQREAKSASRLNHPNSIQIIDSGRDSDGTLYIAMELLKGRDLAQVLREDFPLPLPRVVRIMTQVLSALEEAHLQGVIHRDLKPSNIMLVEWRGEADYVKVCDFGIAKAQHDASEAMLTIQGLVCGTPEYMSPEQARAETLDGRADLYSAAVILYQLVTGDIPFRAPTPMGIVSRHLSDVPVPPSERRPDLGIPPEIDDLVLRAMSKSRETRPPTAAAFRADLIAIAEGRPQSGSFAKTLLGLPNRTAVTSHGTTVRLGDTGTTGARGWMPWLYRAAVLALVGGGAAVGVQRIRNGTAVSPAAEVPRFAGPATPKAAPTGETTPTGEMEPVVAASALPSLPARAEAVPGAPAATTPSAAVAAPSDSAASPRERAPSERPLAATSGSHGSKSDASARSKQRPKGDVSSRPKVLSVPSAAGAALPGVGEQPPSVVPASSVPAPPSLPPETARGPRDIVQEGERLLGQGAVAQACTRGEEARKQFPKYAPAYKFLGKCYMRAGRPGDAKDAYRKYLELSPSAPDAAFIEEIIKQK